MSAWGMHKAFVPDSYKIKKRFLQFTLFVAEPADKTVDAG